MKLETLKGKKVIGKIIFLSPRRIEIEIVAPYFGYSTGLGIPYFAISQSTQFFCTNKKITHKGIEIGRKLLIQLYTCLKFTKKHRALVKKALAECKMNPRQRASIMKKYNIPIKIFDAFTASLIEQLMKKDFCVERSS